MEASTPPTRLGTVSNQDSFLQRHISVKGQLRGYRTKIAKDFPFCALKISDRSFCWSKGPPVISLGQLTEFSDLISFPCKLTGRGREISRVKRPTARNILVITTKIQNFLQNSRMKKSRTLSCVLKVYVNGDRASGWGSRLCCVRQRTTCQSNLHTKQFASCSLRKAGTTSLLLANSAGSNASHRGQGISSSLGL